MAFAEVRFPTNIEVQPVGGPGFNTTIAFHPFTGKEKRNRNRSRARLRWTVGLDDRELSDVHTVLEFFYARAGKWEGFRFKDWSDYKSVSPDAVTTNVDVEIGIGDGATTTYQLIKKYTSGSVTYTRTITKPVSGSLKVSVGGAAQTQGIDYQVNTTTGIVTFTGGSIPGNGASIKAGFEFDIPVRFDVDDQEIEVRTHEYGSWPSLDIVEIVV